MVAVVLAVPLLVVEAGPETMIPGMVVFVMYSVDVFVIMVVTIDLVDS